MAKLELKIKDGYWWCDYNGATYLTPYKGEKRNRIVAGLDAIEYFGDKFKLTIGQMMAFTSHLKHPRTKQFYKDLSASGVASRSLKPRQKPQNTPGSVLSSRDEYSDTLTK